MKIVIESITLLVGIGISILIMLYIDRKDQQVDIKSEYDLTCEHLSGGAGIVHCSNNEVICYTISGALQCKFKDSNVRMIRYVRED